MISKDCLLHLRRLAGVNFKATSGKGFSCRTATRSMATVADIPSSANTDQDSPIADESQRHKSPPSPNSHITTTVYAFPTMEPLRFAYYPHSQLYLPLRKDILHRAVIFEGDAARQGTANTKWRDEVHGSHKKMYRQKGTGKARVGDKQSPIRRGGGVAFGPKPRDFTTGLNRKVYDLAWRTALSYRYRRGELIIVDRMKNLESTQLSYLEQIFKANGWGNADKRSLLVAAGRNGRGELFQAMAGLGRHGEIAESREVDVKDLLGKGRVVIEKNALDDILNWHSSDLPRTLGMVSSALPPLVEFTQV